MAQNVDLYQQLSRLKRKTFWLKMELMGFGVLALFVGLYPVLLERGALPPVFSILPVEGAGYRTVLMVLGGLALILGFRTTRR